MRASPRIRLAHPPTAAPWAHPRAQPGAGRAALGRWQTARDAQTARAARPPRRELPGPPRAAAVPAAGDSQRSPGPEVPRTRAARRAAARRTEARRAEARRAEARRAATYRTAAYRTVVGRAVALLALGTAVRRMAVRERRVAAAEAQAGTSRSGSRAIRPWPTATRRVRSVGARCSTRASTTA